MVSLNPLEVATLRRRPTNRELTIFLCIGIICTIGYLAWHGGHAQTAAGRITTLVRTTFHPEKVIDLRPQARTSARKPPRVTCMIFTTSDRWPTRGVAVRNTWSRHCHRRRFFYSRLAPNKSEPIQKEPDALAVNVSEGREYLTAKTMNALAFCYRNFGDDTDWYLKADDDTYVLWRNLITYLRRFDPENFSYHGHAIFGMPGVHLPKGYNSGGGGYVLSRQATTRVISEGVVKFPGNCRMSGQSAWEDVDMGGCLSVLGVYPTDTRDSQRRLTFHGLSPLTFLRGMMGEGSNDLAPYFSLKYNEMVMGNYGTVERILSDKSISFHYVTPAEMIFIDSLL